MLISISLRPRTEVSVYFLPVVGIIFWLICCFALHSVSCLCTCSLLLFVLICTLVFCRCTVTSWWYCATILSHRAVTVSSWRLSATRPWNKTFYIWQLKRPASLTVSTLTDVVVGWVITITPAAAAAADDDDDDEDDVSFLTIIIPPFLKHFIAYNSTVCVVEFVWNFVCRWIIWPLNCFMFLSHCYRSVSSRRNVMLCSLQCALAEVIFQVR